MKKKFKKLSLSTETLRNLTEPDLKQVAGAATIGDTDCNTLNCTFCTANCTFCTAPCTFCTAPCTVCCP